MTKSIETLLFDFGGTLDSDGVAWKERFYDLYQAEGLDMSENAFATVFFAADDPLVGGLPSSTGLPATIYALVANLEVELARRCGAEMGGAVANRRGGDRGRRIASEFLSNAAAAFARNRPVLEALKERYRLGIVSNFYGNLEAVCQTAGLASLFEVMVDSQQIGIEKPDPAIFLAALDALQAPPRTAVFVGDSLRRDREGSQRAGMDFIWIASQDIQAAEASASGAPSHAAVTELRGLMNILV
jgi:HAD superfamily hydrolase (TIGR01509 family)